MAKEEDNVKEDIKASAPESAAGPLPAVKKTIAQHRKASFYVKKYCMIFLGSIIASIGLELFLIPNRVIDGGVVGISIMMSTITQLPFGLFLVLLNLPFLYLGYKQIGKNFAVATMVAICFLSGWSAVFEPLRQVTEDPFLAAIFGGIIDGLGVGLIIARAARSTARRSSPSSWTGARSSPSAKSSCSSISSSSRARVCSTAGTRRCTRSWRISSSAR